MTKTNNGAYSKSVWNKIVELRESISGMKKEYSQQRKMLPIESDWFELASQEIEDMMRDLKYLEENGNLDGGE
jgi:hypothetical protein